MTPGVEFVELTRDVAMRDGPTIPAGTVGYVVGVHDPYVRVRWPTLDAAAMHAPADLRPSTESAWEAGRAVLRTEAAPPLLSRGELMELDVDRLVEKILGLRGDIADDAEEMAALRATITTLTAERDAALSRATAAEARGDEVLASMERIRDRELCEADRDVQLGTHAVPSGSHHYAAACAAIECIDALAAVIAEVRRLRAIAAKDGAA